MVVPAQKRIIHVSGLVKNPGKYELPITEDIHLLDAIALAGGYSSLVADKVLIIRRVPGQELPITIQASLRGSKRNGRENLLVAPGDSISLEQTPTTVVVDTFARIIHFSVGVTGASTIF
jgi:polysaccharide export outer membrane protein